MVKKTIFILELPLNGGGTLQNNWHKEYCFFSRFWASWVLTEHVIIAHYGTLL